MPLDCLHDITGIILVGGKSRRMGSDKAFLALAGKPLFVQVLEAFKENFHQVAFVGDREECFTDYRLPFFSDCYPGSAMGGLYTGLYHALTTAFSFPPATSRFLAECFSVTSAPLRNVLTRLCRPPPADMNLSLLSTLKNCLGPMKQLLKNSNYCVYYFCSQVQVRFDPSEALARLDEVRRSYQYP